LSEYKPPKLEISWDPGYIVEQILAFTRSVYYLGIKGEERAHYWKLLVWTIFRDPKVFPLAVVLAIYGYHFRTVCERLVL
jgi:hypothetical protein